MLFKIILIFAHISGAFPPQAYFAFFSMSINVSGTCNQSADLGNCKTCQLVRKCALNDAWLPNGSLMC